MERGSLEAEVNPAIAVGLLGPVAALPQPARADRRHAEDAHVLKES
jgi:hypothetical protein